MDKKIIAINGKHYDAHTGLPLDDSSQSAVAPAKITEKIIHHSQAIHQSPQKSQTLNRRSVKKIAPIKAAPAVTAAPSAPRALVQKSPTITRFARHTPVVAVPSRLMSDIGPRNHPMVQNVHHKIEKGKVVHHLAPKPAHIIKQETLKNALASSPSHHTDMRVKRTKKAPRLLSLASAGVALLLLAGYFTYLNMPNISVRVAAAQAGINASYPSYHPDGYSLNGPVAYNDGEVRLKFASNAGPQNFSITQSRSYWDSSALQENYIKPNWGDNYTTFAEHGLTIYTNGSDAVWVNGGIRYTIEGDAPLSSSQLRSIAASL